MRLFARKPDPLREYERRLAAREAELRAEIARLHARIEEEQNRPKLRSTAHPPTPTAPEQLAFEQVSHQRVIHPLPPENTAGHYNELGVRKYDPLARLRRWWQQMRTPRQTHPSLVRLLAAGNVHGLKPLRYEKRVARNRFLGLVIFFFLVIWGLIYFQQR